MFFPSLRDRPPLFEGCPPLPPTSLCSLLCLPRSAFPCSLQTPLPDPLRPPQHPRGTKIPSGSRGTTPRPRIPPLPGLGRRTTGASPSSRRAAPTRLASLARPQFSDYSRLLSRRHPPFPDAAFPVLNRHCEFWFSRRRKSGATDRGEKDWVLRGCIRARLSRAERIAGLFSSVNGHLFRLGYPFLGYVLLAESRRA